MHHATPAKLPSQSAKPTDRPLAILLQHVGKLLDDQFRARLDRLGLPPAQGLVLRFLAGQEGTSQHELTLRMRIAAPTVTGILQRMEASGLIERRGAFEGTRITRIYLTPAGRKQAAAAQHAVEEAERVLTANLSPEELRIAHQVLRRLRDNLGGRGPADEPPIEQIGSGQQR